tara:strand:- start:380 stop:631 length:252 start_codon:yes stop_codon:yes gene_type:complete
MFIKTFFIVITGTLMFTIFKTLRKGKKRTNHVRGKINMIDWMRMSSEDRFLSDIKDRNDSVKRKKILIGNIRKEYKNFSKKSN